MVKGKVFSLQVAWLLYYGLFELGYKNSPYIKRPAGLLKPI